MKLWPILSLASATSSFRSALNAGRHSPKIDLIEWSLLSTAVFHTSCQDRNRRSFNNWWWISSGPGDESWAFGRALFNSINENFEL